MPDFTSTNFEEHQLETRVSRLTDKVALLSSLDADRWETTAWLANEISLITERHEELVNAVFALKQKKLQIGQRLGVFTSIVLKKIKSINERLDAHDKIINDLSAQMKNLSIN